MASRLQDVIQRGLAADRPVATDVAPGTLYYSTDTSVTERSDGSTWESYADASSGGIPGLHASTHAVGGTDPVNVTGLAGYPGGTTNFLRADGAFAALPAGAARIGGITMIIDGGTSVITTGVKGYLEIPFACTIQAVTLLADVSGSIVIDIWKDVYANYPPVVADTITASAKPTISAATKSQNVTLTGWTTSITAGDILGFNVDSVTTIKKVTLSLKVQVP
jgi:hypothetical protein